MRAVSTGRRSLRAHGALAALALATALGCGKEGPPKPPESELPEAVKDLTANAVRGAVELRFSVPQKNQDGSKPPDVSGFQVMHALLPIAGETSVVASKTQVAFALPVPLDMTGAPLKKAVVRDTSAVPDTINVYRVVTYGSSGFPTEPSNGVSIAWAVPPGSPSTLEATPAERAATLRWTAPAARSDGKLETRPILYRVLRWTGESEPELVTPEPVADTTWTDTSAPIDRTHNYVVRAVVRNADVWIESDDSPTASVIAEDRTPPAPPTALVGVRSPNGIEIRWTPSSDADVAGYYVYRLRPSGAADKLTPNPIESTRFVDAHPPLGDIRYRVTAVDRSANANESPPSETVTVR